MAQPVPAERTVEETLATLEDFLRKMPIWDSLEKLLVECKELKQQMIELSASSMNTKLDMDALPMFNSFKHLDIKDKVQAYQNKLIIPLPAYASYIQDPIRKKVFRVPVEEDICVTPQKIREKQLEQSLQQKNISIVNLESKLTIGEIVYVCYKSNKPWIPGQITSIYESRGVMKIRLQEMVDPGAQPRLNSAITTDKFRIARLQRHENHLLPSKRVIAGIATSLLMPGIVAEAPNNKNERRYLIFFDNGSARYHKPNDVYPILGQSRTPWKDVITNDKESKVSAHLRTFFANWPKQELLSIEPERSVNIEYKKDIVEARCLEVDCSIMRLEYPDRSEESIYRGSPRIITKKDNLHISDLLKDESDTSRFHEKLKSYIDLYAGASMIALDEGAAILSRYIEDRGRVGICRRNVATKSTTQKNDKSTPIIKVDVTGAQVEDCEDHDGFNDENETHKRCTKECLRECPNLDDKYRNVSVLKIPLLIGWRRTIKNIPTQKNRGRSQLRVLYESPCGRIFKLPSQIFRYIRDTGSQLDVDYFSFDIDVRFYSRDMDSHILAKVFEQDLSIVKRNDKWVALERKPVSLINTVSNERLPEDFEYRSTRFFHPNLEKKGFTFNEEFRSCCDCDDDCASRTNCSCQNLTEDFYLKAGSKRGTFVDRIQYKSKRLSENVRTGIFECNPSCKCSSKCPNRVVQLGLRYRLQVFKTVDKGWGVRTLDDIPKGAFVSTYSAEVLDDADQYGDSDVYFADLDYITVNESFKEGYESEVEESEDESTEGSTYSPRKEKSGRFRRKNNIDPSDSDSEISELNEDDIASPESSKPSQEQSSGGSDDDCIFYDPDEGLRNDYDYVPADKKDKKKKRRLHSNRPRYPKRRRAQLVPTKVRLSKPSKQSPVKFKRIQTILGTKNNFTLDARMQGNVGRFYNHCCDPNTFVQNVFIDTHDLRFPIVAFFASCKIDAMSEITWNYQYHIGSIPGRVMKCYCGTMSCRGRIL